MTTSRDLDPEPPAPEPPTPRKRAAGALDRRRFLATFAGLGLAGPALPAALWAAAEEAGGLTPEVLADAEKVTGLTFTAPERELMLKGLAELRADYEKVRAVPLANGVPPAFRFDPDPPGLSGAGAPASASNTVPRRSRAAVPRVPADLEELAFAPVTELARLVETGRVRSIELTEMYLARLERYDPLLECVVTLTADRARAQAARADREIAAGRYRGPLHGIPWGAKDLLAVAGYPTTWGAMPYRDQVIAADAAVVRRLDAAGAVLVAKLTLGALAWGDVWFGGKTRNPWNPEQGSSGSSAGSSSAVAAGLVGFAIGTETWGSIVSPATRCGATGLRPTFGRVSRDGAMALSWTMDKIGPLCRAVEDCALVFDAIHGPEGDDPTVADRPFGWNSELDPRRLRVGYVKELFEAKPEEGEEEAHAHALAALAALRDLGVEPVPFALPADLPVEALAFILSAEAAAAFDELTRSGRDDLLVRQIENAWPNVFRQARWIPAVEYVQANRVRTLLMREMAARMAGFDAYVVPSFGGSNLLLTNLTGHPMVVVPAGFRADGTPTSISFVGNLWGEAAILALAKAYQDATGHHLRHPDLDAVWAAYRAKQEAEKAKAATDAAPQP